jgi:arginine decarboxylase
MRFAAAAARRIDMKTEWDVESAIATYNVEGWGDGYFTVNSSGNVEARPLKEDGGSIDLLEVVNEARARNLGFPLLIRFQDLLRHRVESVNRAFQSAISEFAYGNEYRGVFPIKVNQLREVIEEIVDAGQQFHFGLEAGSKPELVAALAMHKDPESLVICNGYKDPAFIRIALLGCKLGKSVVIVVEKPKSSSKRFALQRKSVSNRTSAFVFACIARALANGRQAVVRTQNSAWIQPAFLLPVRR